MTSKSRRKEFAKQAARRDAVRREEAHRQRNRRLMVVAGLAAVAVIVGAVLLFTGEGEPGPGGPSDGPQPAATPSGEPGKVTGTVDQVVEPPETVACDGEVPETVGEPKPQFEAPDLSGFDPEGDYVAEFTTSCGVFEAELLVNPNDDAPVGSFIFLAEEGFFDGLTFHRVVPGFVIQGGDPLGDGTGTAGFDLPVSVLRRPRFGDGEGFLAYAHAAASGNSSQFFITLAPNPTLDVRNRRQAGYTIFGRVTEGMDVVRRITEVPVGPNAGIPGENSVPEEAVYIESVRIKEGPSGR